MERMCSLTHLSRLAIFLLKHPLIAAWAPTINPLTSANANLARLPLSAAWMHRAASRMKFSDSTTANPRNRRCKFMMASNLRIAFCLPLYPRKIFCTAAPAC